MHIILNFLYEKTTTKQKAKANKLRAANIPAERKWVFPYYPVINGA